jgi:hypothetical protein
MRVWELDLQSNKWLLNCHPIGKKKGGDVPKIPSSWSRDLTHCSSIAILAIAFYLIFIEEQGPQYIVSLIFNESSYDYEK